MTRAGLAVRCLAAFVIACLVAIAFHRIFMAPRQAREAIAEATLQGEMAEGHAQAAQESIRTSVQIERQKVIVDRITVENDHAIKQAADADLRVPDVKRALDRALCLRDAYKSEPDCAAVPGAGGGIDAAGPDAGSGAAD